VDDFGDEIQAGKLLDIGFYERGIHALGTAVDIEPINGSRDALEDLLH